MGYFYVGYNPNNWKNGKFKIGETGNKLSIRINQIKQKEPFQMLGNIKLNNETKAERLYIESYVRMRLEKEKELTHYGNDHFSYINNKGEKGNNALKFTLLALNYAREACFKCGIDFE